MPKSVWQDEYQALLVLLKEIRITKAISQVELARRLNTNQSVVSKCERGERRLDLIDLLKHLRALEVHPEVFLEELNRRLPAVRRFRVKTGGSIFTTNRIRNASSVSPTRTVGMVGGQATAVLPRRYLKQIQTVIRAPAITVLRRIRN